MINFTSAGLYNSHLAACAHNAAALFFCSMGLVLTGKTAAAGHKTGGGLCSPWVCDRASVIVNLLQQAPRACNEGGECCGDEVCIC